MSVVSRFLMSTRGAYGRGLSLGLLLLSLGCKGSGPTQYVVEKAPEVSPAARTAAQALYTERCAKCHGATGAGDGPMATAIHPQPQRLTDRVWQANVTNKRLRLVIIHGGLGVNRSAVMPAYPDLAQQPEALDGLVALIRGFAAP